MGLSCGNLFSCPEMELSLARRLLDWSTRDIDELIEHTHWAFAMQNVPHGLVGEPIIPANLVGQNAKFDLRVFRQFILRLPEDCITVLVRIVGAV